MIQSNVQNNADLKTNLLMQIGNRFNKTAFSDGNFSDILALNTREIYKNEIQLTEIKPITENDFSPVNNEVIQIKEKEFKQENFTQPEPIHKQSPQENLMPDDEIVLENQAINPEHQSHSDAPKPDENSESDVLKIDNKPAESLERESSEIKIEAPTEKRVVTTDVKPEITSDIIVNADNKQNIGLEIKAESVIPGDTDIAPVKTMVPEKNIAQEQILSAEFETVTGKEATDLQQIVNNILNKQNIKTDSEIIATQAETKVNLASLLNNGSSIENLAAEIEKVTLNPNKPTIEQFLTNQVHQAEIKNAVVANLTEEKQDIILNVKSVSQETVLEIKEETTFNNNSKPDDESLKPVIDKIKFENPEKSEAMLPKNQVHVEEIPKVKTEEILASDAKVVRNQDNVQSTISEVKRTPVDTDLVSEKNTKSAENENSVKLNVEKLVEKSAEEMVIKNVAKIEKPVIETSPKIVQNETPKIINQNTETGTTQYEHFTKLNNQDQQSYVSTTEKYTETEKAVSGEQVSGSKDNLTKAIVGNNEVTVKSEVSTKRVEELAEASNQNVDRAVITKPTQQTAGIHMRSLISKISKIIEANEIAKPTQTKFVIDGQKYGDIEVEFVRKASENQAMIRVASEEVKAELDKHMPELRETLQEKGISMNSLDVEVNQKEQKDGSLNAESGKNFTRNMKSGYSKGAVKDSDEDVIVSRTYGYNTMELIA